MNVTQIRQTVAMALAVLLVGIWAGYGLANGTIRKAAIAQSCAFYDSKTAEFKWGQPQ